MIYLVRKESETPNIQNTEDIVGFKYASAGVNGVVKNYLNQMNYEINNRDFKVRSGEAIVDGWQVKVDAEGALVTVNNTNSTEYCVVYIEVDLTVADSKQAFLKLVYDTATYPQIDRGDDISVTHTGIARMELYRFVHSGGTINNVEPRFQILDGEAYIAKYASKDISKGTIEERLTKLGFKQGSFNLENTSTVSTDSEGRPYGTVQMTAETNEIKRQGNYCIANLKLSFKLIRNPDYSSNSSSVSYGAKVNVPKGFRPKVNMKYYTAGMDDIDKTTGYTFNLPAHIYINIDGTVQCSTWSFADGGARVTFSSLDSNMTILNFGWEAPPL